MKTPITIESPCNADWATMTGDQRRRFCGACKKHVHDLSAMRQDEAEALVRGAKGRLCVRYQPDTNGGVKHRRPRGRMARWGAAALAGLAAVPAFASGRVDTEGGGMGTWIAEVVTALAEEALGTVTEPMIMGEMAIETEPHAFENRTGGTLTVDCGLEQAVIEPGASARLEGWPHQACTVNGAHGSQQVDLREVLCTPAGDGFTCAPPPSR